MIVETIATTFKIIFRTVRLLYYIFRLFTPNLNAIYNNWHLIPRAKRKPDVVELYNAAVTPMCPICHETYAHLEWKLSVYVNCGHTFCSECLVGTKRCPLCNQAGAFKKIFIRQ
jgi:hypothetical protein